MASVNKVILLGNLGADPDVRYTPDGGTAICTLSLATSRRYKNRDGQFTEETEWHRVVLFGRTAEIARDYLKKGRSVNVEGRLRQGIPPQGQPVLHRRPPAHPQVD